MATLRSRKARKVRKAEARERAISNFIEIRENPKLRNPLYLNSCPAKQYADPWPERPVARKRRSTGLPRAAATYRGALATREERRVLMAERRLRQWNRTPSAGHVDTSKYMPHQGAQECARRVAKGGA